MSEKVVRKGYNYVATATKIRFHFQFLRSTDAAFDGRIGWLSDWNFEFWLQNDKQHKLCQIQ